MVLLQLSRVMKKEKEDYKNLLKSESPSLENFLNDYNLGLSVN